MANLQKVQTSGCPAVHYPTVPKLLNDYRPDDIFNADESGFFLHTRQISCVQGRFLSYYIMSYHIPIISQYTEICHIISQSYPNTQKYVISYPNHIPIHRNMSYHIPIISQYTEICHIISQSYPNTQKYVISYHNHIPIHRNMSYHIPIHRNMSYHITIISQYTEICHIISQSYPNTQK